MVIVQYISREMRPICCVTEFLFKINCPLASRELRKKRTETTNSPSNDLTEPVLAEFKKN